MLNNEKEIDLYDDVSNPLDGIEEIMVNNDWIFDRMSYDEMTVHISGKHGTYKMVFVWQEEFSALQFCCAPDLSISPLKTLESLRIINDINADLWLGHFDFRPESEGSSSLTPCFRHTSLFRGMTGGSGVAHMEDLIDIALHECERYYMTFSLLSQSKLTCPKDLSLALMDVAGLS